VSIPPISARPGPGFTADGRDGGAAAAGTGERDSDEACGRRLSLGHSRRSLKGALPGAPRSADLSEERQLQSIGSAGQEARGQRGTGILARPSPYGSGSAGIIRLPTRKSAEPGQDQSRLVRLRFQTVVEGMAMAESVAELLSRLRFVGGPVETLYLNEVRVRESFIGQLGAIESFTRAATKEGSVEAPVVKIGAGISSEAGVSWNLGDPITQVLVLRAALESQGLLYGITEAKPGLYVSFVGTGQVSRPDMFDDLHRDTLREHRGLYDALGAERAKQESIVRMTENSEKSLWLLTVSDGVSICAAVLDSKWLRPVFSHWMNPDYAVSRWEVFALCRRIHQTRVPMLATLYVGVKW
jgi:hypothetical protein